MSLITILGVVFMLPMLYVVGSYLGQSLIEAWRYDKKMVIVMLVTYSLFIIGAILITYGKK